MPILPDKMAPVVKNSTNVKTNTASKSTKKDKTVTKIKTGQILKHTVAQSPKVYHAMEAVLRDASPCRGAHPRQGQASPGTPMALEAEGGSCCFRSDATDLDTSDVIKVVHDPSASNRQSPLPNHEQSMPASELRQMFTFIKDSISDIRNNVADIRQEMAAQETRILHQMDAKIEKTHVDLRSELVSATSTLQTRISTIEQTLSNNDGICDDLCSIIVKNLVESDTTSDEAQVKDLFSNGLGLKDININHVSRKTKMPGSRYPGIVTAKVKKDDKLNIMKTKRTLKNSGKYSKVYIEDYMSPSEKKVNDNIRKILKVTGNDKHFSMVNGRLLEKRA
ncbi:unnamed protein product [Owenia fusiformis]|uniref:Uncharacterized protein n=1 Tax=Owenia fusiformis TaxID=6347 RepID=A0A8S4PDQ5_OWEFU|nr:unnamed protein product [Owenia fusiformis]